MSAAHKLCSTKPNGNKMPSQIYSWSVCEQLHLGNFIIVFYPFAILAVCKDEEGSFFLTKDENGLQLSHCMDCHCRAGFLTCRRKLTTNFPGYYYALYVHNENCAQPQCNVAKFVREKRDHCEGNKSPSLNLLIILLLEWTIKSII